MNFWSNSLRVAHPGARKHFSDIDPNEWHDEYKARMKLATKEYPIFRHMGKIDRRLKNKSLRYRRSNEIKDGERERFFSKLLLPSGSTGSYVNIFKKARGSVVRAWLGLFKDVLGKTTKVRYVKNWILDTGVDVDTVAIHFWPKRKKG
jgi:hypothetical protein